VDDVKEYLDMGCAGVMLARGALADPYLFPLALRALGRQVPDELWNPTPERRSQQLHDLSERSREVSGPRSTLVLLKRMMAGMFKGVPGVTELRRRVGSAADLDELPRLLAEWLGEKFNEKMHRSPSSGFCDVADFERSGTDDSGA
jgi:tRNA-dihydrouridine synthase